MWSFYNLLQAQTQDQLVKAGRFPKGYPPLPLEEAVQKIRDFLQDPKITSNKTGLEWLKSPEKRQFDLAFCAVLLPAVYPMVASAAGLMAKDGKPPFFAQERIGKGGVPFGMWKIRTMTDTNGMSLSAGGDEPEPTEDGDRIRRSILDEYAQLWNMYYGNMTWCATRALVGIEISPKLGAPGQRVPEFTMESVLGPKWFPRWFNGCYTAVPPGLVSPGANYTLGQPKDWEFQALRAAYDFWYFGHGNLSVDLEQIQTKMDVSVSVIRSQLANGELW